MAIDLNIDPAFVRILILKAAAGMNHLPESDEDQPIAEIEVDAATTLERQRTDRLSDELEPDETLAEVAALIEDLNVDEKAELVALAWVGRGTYDADAFGEAPAAARERTGLPVADYLLGMELLPSYLELGLEAIGEDPRPATEV